MRVSPTATEMQQRVVLLLVLAAALFALPGCGGGGGGGGSSGGTGTSQQPSAQAVGLAVDAKVFLTPLPGPVALDVNRARAILLRIHDGTGPSAPVAREVRVDLTGGTQSSDAELPGLGAGSYLIVARVLGDLNVVLAETGCVFPLAPGPATDLSVVVNSTGIKLGDGTGICPGGNPLPAPAFSVEIASITGPVSAARGQSGLPYQMRVRNTGTVVASVNTAFLAFTGAGISSLLSTALPLSLNPSDVATLTFAVAVSNTAAIGVSSIRGTVIANGPGIPDTSVAATAPTSLTVRATSRDTSDAQSSADLVLGQLDYVSTSPNAGGAVSCNGLNSPASVASDGARLAVSDTGNNRVLIYDANHPSAPLAVLGQPGFSSSSPGGGRREMDAPMGLAFEGRRLLVADTGNNRVLVYDDVAALPAAGGEPTAVLDAKAFPKLTEPQVMAVVWTSLFVADTANNRVLRFPFLPAGR